MTTALCLGGAAGVRDDWTAALALGDFDFIVACNDVGAIWPGRLDIWCTLHPEHLTRWRDQRRANGHPDAARYLVHGDYCPDWTELVEFRFPGQDNSGSSGLFAAKAALIDLRADRAVLAGIPLSRTSHFFDAAQWEAAGGYREVWEALWPKYRARIRSMSGWTAYFFGPPTTEWLTTGATGADELAPTLENTRMSKITLDKIAYESHPVSLERKRELNAKGYKVVDIAFAPKDAKRTGPELRSNAATSPFDHDGDGKPGGSLPADERGLDDLRAEASALGIKADKRWGEARLRDEIAKAKS